jgi:hypothetical protein
MLLLLLLLLPPVRMGDRYTLSMLALELWALTQNSWQVFPKAARETRADGTVCHGTTDDPESFFQAFISSFANAPEKVLAGTPRGASINCQLDQSRLLQYFAWAGQAIDVGVAFSVDNFQIEYWFSLVLQPVPNDEDQNVHLTALQAWVMV